MERVGNDDQDDGLKAFASLIQQIALDRLPDLAISVRHSLHSSQRPLSAEDAPAIACTVVQPPVFGSYNLVYVLRFEDRVRWICRFPAHGCKNLWSERSARALESQALTMRLIARETTVPIPQVYHHNSTISNELNCPFVLMDYIDGISGPEAWFNSSIDNERTLQDLALAMMQLNKLTQHLSGALQFDEAGDVNGVGPYEVDDIAATLAKGEDSSNSRSFRQVGPFATTKAYMLRLLDHRTPPPGAFSHGAYRLLKLFITWVTENETDSYFVVTHPDLDIQNIIVKEDGSLAGIIDWDGVATSPLCLGADILPSWLTRDWDSAYYAYSEDADSKGKENSPAELARYRASYAKYVRQHKAGDNTKQYTGRSLLTHNIYCAADNPMCTLQITGRVFKECVRALEESQVISKEGQPPGVAQEDSDEEDHGLCLYDFVTELVDDDFDPVRVSKLRQGFNAMCTELDRVGID